MPPGKLAAQAGHAYTDCLFEAMDRIPNAVDRYRRNGHGGSKVTLKAKNLASLQRAEREARGLGLITALVVDRDHVLPPHFDGSPIVTALGIGPVTKDAAREVVKRLQCV
jgi:peptidyl-tRNA hydrolase